MNVGQIPLQIRGESGSLFGAPDYVLTSELLQ